MKVNLAAWFLLFTLTVACGTAFAHHGNVAYDEDHLLTLKNATVTSFIWANPHSFIKFDITDDKGNVVHWGAELGNPHQLSSAGFSRDVMKPGDKITIFGHPSRNGAPRLQFDHVVLPDGHTLSMKNVKGNGEKADTDY